MNQALILLVAWRVADQPNDFLHDVLKSKYFPDSSVWRPKPNVPKLAFWSSIIKVLSILKTHSFYQITQGNISIWSTPWCQDWTHIYDALIIQPAGFVYPVTVKDMWLPNQQAWNDQLIDMLFQQPMAEKIKQTSLIRSLDNDILCWKLSPSGKCNTKSGVPCVSSENAGTWRTSAKTCSTGNTSNFKTNLEEQANAPEGSNLWMEIS
jgi:hypothetical protein